MANIYTDDLDKALASMNRERTTKLVLVIAAIFATAIGALVFAELSSPYLWQQLQP